MWYIMEYSSALEGRKFWYVTPWMNLQDIMPGKINQSQKDKYDSAYMKYLE